MTQARLDLDARLAALEEALRLAEGRLDPAEVGLGWAVCHRAGERLGHGVEHTVVALAGATGSGKSSLFNLLAGSPLSPEGVRRPTTATAHACVWGADPADGLLDWLGVPRRHRVALGDPAPSGYPATSTEQVTWEAGSREPVRPRLDVGPGLLPGEGQDLEGLVLLDLPDHDSTEVAHRLEVDRLVERVDLLVWVLDPQKYADAAVHERYLRPLAGHAHVTLVVLNHVDRLHGDEASSCLVDLRRLLAADGLRSVTVLVTSARTRQGLDQLRQVLAQRVAERRAAVERLAADLEAVVNRLDDGCGAAPEKAGKTVTIEAAERERLVDALAQAGGVPLVGEAVAASHRRRAALTVGWPFTRWLRRLRPDPLGRLHLGLARSLAGQATRGRDRPLERAHEAPLARTSLPPPTPVQRANVASALRSLAHTTAGHLPAPWPGHARRVATSEEERLPDLLDRTVATTDLDTGRPRWWSLAAAGQVALAVAATLGALWLAGLLVLEWLRLPEPEPPRVGEVPVPTALAALGLSGGVILAWLAARLAAVGAERRRRATLRRLRGRIGRLADDRVLLPLQEELTARRSLCAALQRARREGR